MTDNEKLKQLENRKVSELKPGDVIKYEAPGSVLSITVPERGRNLAYSVHPKGFEPEVILVEKDKSSDLVHTTVHLGILKGIRKEINGHVVVSDTLPEALSPDETVVLDKFVGGETSATILHQFPSN